MTPAQLLLAGYTEITGVDLVALVQRAYDLSTPVGLGRLQYVPGPLSREDAACLVQEHATRARFAVSLDYVRGRAVKLDVWRADGAPERLFLPPEWYDHTDEQRARLLHETTPGTPPTEA
jgi:hypothetical protein